MDYSSVLELKNVKIINFQENGSSVEILIQKATTSEICPTCKTPSSSVKNYRIHPVITRPIENVSLHILVNKRCFRCHNLTCSTKYFTEEIEGLKKKHVYADSFENFLENLYKHMDLPTIKKRLSDIYKLPIPASTIYEKLKNKPVESQLLPYPIQTKYIGLDEFSYTKGHNYGVILTDLVKGKIIDMVAGGKTTAAAKAVLNQVVPESVEAVCIDMWEPFKIACLEKLPNAIIVVDKFHVIKQLNEAIENVRKRIAPDLPEEQSTFLFKNRFILLTGKERLSDIQRTKLTNLLSFNKELATIYEAKESLRELYQIKNINIAYPEFRRWILYAKDTNIPELLKLAETYSEWFTFIFNYWHCPITNAVTEGKINKLRVIQTKAYHYRNFWSLRYHMLREEL